MTMTTYQIASSAGQSWTPGDRVAAGKGDERDAGIVVEITGPTALVAWDSGATTPVAVSALVPTSERWSGGRRVIE
jgi:hypothetical protein